MQQPERRGAQRGLLVRGAGRGCLSTPRVLDFLCFEAPPPVLGGEEGDEELPLYLASQGSLEEHVRQVQRAGRGMRAGTPPPPLSRQRGAMAAVCIGNV